MFRKRNRRYRVRKLGTALFRNFEKTVYVIEINQTAKQKAA